MHTKQGEQTGDEIVQHDAESAVNAAIKPGDGPGLEYIEQPEQHKAVSPAELAHIQRGRGKVVSHHLSAAAWKRILTNRSLLALCLAYFTQTYGFYFFITWMPTYLENARGFTSTMLGVMAGLPLVMSAAADLFGGLTTDWATKRFGLRVGRCGVGGICYLDEIVEARKDTMVVIHPLADDRRTLPMEKLGQLLEKFGKGR